MALAIVAGGWWFLVMSFSLLTGVGDAFVTAWGISHPFWSYTWGGMIMMVVQHLIYGFAGGWILARLYNRFQR
ncbi:MAG: hypothetical protein HYW38_01795 [Candidatus Colwellbacteria bacterium]|nr:hypothetical protein [Candidatus Colwellbacteria bacterium]